MHLLSKHQLLHKLMVLLPPKLMVLMPPKRLLLLLKLKLLMLNCPQFHLASKVSKTGTSNGRKKSVVWNHFEKIKVEEGVTRLYVIIAKNHIMLIVRVMVLVIC